MNPCHRLALIAGGWLENSTPYVSGSRWHFGKVQLSSQKNSNKGVSPRYPLLRFLVTSWQIICTFHFRMAWVFFFSPPTNFSPPIKPPYTRIWIQPHLERLPRGCTAASYWAWTTSSLSTWWWLLLRSWPTPQPQHPTGSCQRIWQW